MIFSLGFIAGFVVGVWAWVQVENRAAAYLAELTKGMERYES